MREYTVDEASFSEGIMITEETDEASADNVNAAPKQLLENTLFLKEKVEQAELLLNNKLEEVNQSNQEFEQRVTEKLNENTADIVLKLSTSAERRFKDLYGIANKTVNLSADGSTVTSVSEDIKVTTTISKSEENTMLTTIVEKGVEGQDGFERYTKTTVMSTLTDGRKQVTVNYTKNV